MTFGPIVKPPPPPDEPEWRPIPGRKDWFESKDKLPDGSRRKKYCPPLPPPAPPAPPPPMPPWAGPYIVHVDPKPGDDLFDSAYAP